MLQALKAFPGLPHRCQWVAERAGVTYYDDSKGTNVGAILASLEGLQGPMIWLAGGQSKGADFAPLADVLRRKVRAMVLFGEDAACIEQALAGTVPVHRAASLEQAVTVAASLACKGDSVLLSPGCASFDMFSGFEERGERFQAAVGGLDPCAA
jgi:UDP-N-acetylmuramoylalanine--D-glutamate ligase